MEPINAEQTPIGEDVAEVVRGIMDFSIYFLVL